MLVLNFLFNISTSVNRSNFTLLTSVNRSFLKLLAMLILVQKEDDQANGQDQGHVLRYMIRKLLHTSASNNASP